MCGIVGLASGREVGDSMRSAVRRMADVIEHRGPDDDGFYDAPQAVLGMRRLAIIDVAGAQQPISNQSNSIWAVCNGEIYNFRALRSALAERGHQFRNDGDAEVIVHLYEEYGDAFVDHLEGMFAIALWDEPQKKLVLVRDHLGVKPVYYTELDQGVAFASEVKALLKLPNFSARVNQQGLRDYLSIGYCVAPQTIFDGVMKLPPASMLIWQGGEYRVRRYWDMPTEVDTSKTEGDWIEQIASELKRSVQSQMVSDVPIGAFLSGGVDSSAIVAFMAEQSSQPINTYSIGYTGSGTENYYNELSYAREVADQYGTNHHEIEVQPDVAALLPKLMWHMEEPISDSAIATTHLVSELAAQSVTVILSGVGGDELFAGYNRYLGDHYSAKFNRIPSVLRQGIIKPIVNRLPSGRQNRWMDLSRYARSLVKASEMEWRAQYKFFLAIQQQQSLDQLLPGSDSTIPDGLDRVLAAEHSSDSLLRLMRVDCNSQMAEDLLLLTDKMTMANSIECRVPFLDHHFVELAASIPTALKRPGTNLKHLLKQALTGTLSEDILYRKKRGFGAPVGEWFKGQLKPLRDTLLSKSVVESRGLLDWESVKRICRNHDSNKNDFTDLILVLINLEVWSRLFLDGLSHADVSLQIAEQIAERNAA